MSETAKKRVRLALKILAVIIIVPIVLTGAYAAYLFLSYSRLPERMTLETRNSNTAKLTAGDAHTLISYNIGFGAYEPDYSFFMDGGTESWAWSKERLSKNMDNIIDFLKKQNADLIILQETDKDSTRSYHVNECELLSSALTDHSNVFAETWKSAFLFYPFTQPHGNVLSGIMSFSRFGITESERISLPVEDSFMKVIELDRCYIKSRIPVDNGRELVLFNCHFSAYTSDGSIAAKQMRMILDDMENEYSNGNYVICGGDMNTDLLGDSSKYFGVSIGDVSWAKPIDMSAFEGRPISLVASSNAPSCRNADAPYNPSQIVLTVDGFFVSDNVEVIDNKTIDLSFAYSDHNPVLLEFRLK